MNVSEQNLADYIALELKDCSLTNEELIKALKEGDPQAKDRLILKNMGLIHSFIYKNKWLYQDSSLTDEDFIQEGVIAICEAVDKYDNAKSTFSTFVFMVLKTRLYRVYQEKSQIIRIPSHRYEEYNKFRTKEKEISKTLDHSPSTKELARLSGYAVEEIIAFKKDFKKMTSLNAPLGEEANGSELGDIVEDSYNYFEDVEKKIYIKQLNKDLDIALNNLEDDQREILCDVVGWKRKPLTYKKTGIRNGITTDKARQVSQQSIRTIRRLNLKSLTEKYSDFIGYELHREGINSKIHLGMFKAYLRDLYQEGDVIIINGVEGRIEDLNPFTYFIFTYVNSDGSDRTVLIEYEKIKDYKLNENKKFLLESKYSFIDIY